MRKIAQVAFPAIITALILAVPSSAQDEVYPPSAPHPRPAVDWRRTALQDMHVAAAEHLIERQDEFTKYIDVRFNTLVLYDNNGVDPPGNGWAIKSDDQIRQETDYARAHHLPIVLGLGIEEMVTAAASKTEQHSRSTVVSSMRFRAQSNGVIANGFIPAATDAEIEARLAPWIKYGNDLILGVYPMYDDVFWEKLTAKLQRHVYAVIKGIAPEWHVLGMIGESAYNATPADIVHYFDPQAFDDLILLMYPLNVGGDFTGFPLDNVASSDPDGDMRRYVEHYIPRMGEKFFSLMRPDQLIILVGQAFYYTAEPAGHIPRPSDIFIMMTHGNELIRQYPGQSMNRSVGYYYWGADGALIVGLMQRPDWLQAALDVHTFLDGPHVEGSGADAAEDDDGGRSKFVHRFRKVQVQSLH